MVIEQPHLTLSTVVLDAPDAHQLAEFYRRLLGWGIERAEPDWVKLIPSEGGVGLSFQTETDYTPPTWPDRARQVMAHLDIKVDDLDAATEHAVAMGAVLAEYQPEDDVRVCLDPAGHPFCLWIET